MLNKSKSAFRTIAEVANELGVATHVLRFWETKFKEISPMKGTGGRRYYRPDDVALIKLIRDFLYEKRYTIEGVQKIFKEHGVKAFLSGDIQKDFFDSLEVVPQQTVAPQPDVSEPANSSINPQHKEMLCHVRDDLLACKDTVLRLLENN